jgi:hypothetical protein
VVEPGADPAFIGLSFDGADDVRIEADGDLAVLTEGGFLRHRVPIAYQDVDGVRRHVEATFAEDSGGLVRFTVGHHDRSLPLVIDPVIVYARQFGDATSGGNEEAIGIQADAAGNAFVTGFTTSSDFPVTAGAFDTSIGGLYDAFVMKLDPAGNIVWATFLGGSQWEQGRGIALDAAGAVYVTGVTQSPNFPTRRPVQGAFGGGFDAFVTKLNPQGGAWCTPRSWAAPAGRTATTANFLARQAVGDLAVDGDGHAVVTGYTQSSDFPTANALQPEIGGGVCPPGQIPCQDVFISKLSRRGSAFVYSTFLGGRGSEYGHGIAADANGAAYVTGEVIGSDFPTTPGAFQPTPQGGTDYFVTKINGTGSTLAYSTYLGGEGSEFAGSEIAVDARGRAYVTGGTFSFGFPTTPGAFQREKAGDMDVTVTKMNATGSAPVYSTYVGGHDDESGVGIAVDAQGRASLTGLTTSGGTYPEVGELESCSALPEGIATTLNAAGSDVVFSTCLGNVLREGASIDEQDRDLFVGGFTLAGGGATDGMAVRIAE